MEFADHDLGLWNKFQTCRNDETMTEPNKKEECSNLYEVQTIGQILPQEPAFKNPTVILLQAENQALSMAADSFIFLFGNLGSDLKATINLENRVEAMCFRPDGQMIIAADSSGFIHVISIVTGKIIFSHQVITSELEFSKRNEDKCLFCNITCTGTEQENDSYCIAIGLRNTKFFVFHNVKLLTLEKAFNNKDLELGKKAQSAMVMKEYDASKITQMKVMTSMIVLFDGYCNNFITMGKGKTVLSLWKEDVDPFSTCEVNLCPRVKCVSAVPSDLFWADDGIAFVKGVCMHQHLYTLDSTGGFYQWHTSRLVLCRYWSNMGIIDFTITDSGFTNNVHSGKLYALVKDETYSSALSVFKLPTMEKCFTYKPGNQNLCKMAMGSPAIEDVTFTDSEATIRDVVSHLNIRVLSEASPEGRLFRLLNKHRFDEAEKFAELFSLDLQQVYQPKAAYLASIISNSNEDRSSLENKFAELKKCLMNMKDGMMAARLCIDAEIPDLQFCYEMLTTGRSRINEGREAVNLTNGEFELEKNELRLQIINRLDRLVTFRLAYGKSSDESSGKHWLHFCHADLPSELIRLVASGNMSAASIVLLRHKAELLAFLEPDGTDESLMEKHLCGFLEHIPETVDIDAIVSWMEDVLIPILLTRIPGSVKVIASWLSARAQSFELSRPSDWPENGLKMAQVLFNVQNKLAGLGFMRDQMSIDSHPFKSTSTEVSNLRLLVSRLQLLLRLKQRYKCNVTLSEFIQETTMSLTYRMLDRVMVPELVQSSLDLTVRPYMREHNLVEEQVLLGYVEDLLSRFQDQKWGSVESLRERKVVAIIQCMKEPQFILESVVKLAKRASVPWSEDIHELVKKGIKIAESTSDVEESEFAEGCQEKLDESVIKKRKALLKELQNSVHFERLPTVLAEYGLSDVQMRNSSSHIQIVRFLIQRGTPESLSQAYHFCRTFTTISDIDMYRFRLLFLLRQQKVSECVDLLTEVEQEQPELVHDVVCRMIGLAEEILESTNQMFADERNTYCSAAVQMIEHILQSSKLNIAISNPELAKAQNHHFEEEIREKLCLLRNILSLQTRYNEFVSVEQYLDKRFTDSLLACHISSSVTDISTPLSDRTVGKIMSVSDLSSTNTTYSNVKNLSNDSKLEETESESKVSSGGTSTNISQILNLARILDVPSSNLRGQFALQCAKKGPRGALTALSVCRDLFQISPTEDTAETAFHVVLELLKHSSANCSYFIKLVPELIEIAASALVYLSPTLVHEGLELHKFLTLCNEVCKVTDIAGDTALQQQPMARKNPFTSISTLYPWMEEVGGLMLRSDQVLPIFLKTANVLVNDGDFLICHQVHDQKMIDSLICQLREVVTEMTTVLQLAGQPHLALHWIVSCICVSLRHIANQYDPEDKDKNKILTQKMQHIIEEGNKILGPFVEDCVRKVLGSRDVDVKLVVGLLTLVPIAQGHALLKAELTKAGSNYKRITYITRAGIETLRLNSMHSQVKKFEHLFLDSYWGEKLRPMKIPFEKVLFSPSATKSHLLPRIIRHPETTGKLIKEFCRDFDLDEVQALLQFTRVLLSDPHYTIDVFNFSMPLGDEEKAVISPMSMSFKRTDMMVLTPEEVKSKPGLNPKAPNEEANSEEHLNRPWQDVKKQMAFVMKNVDEKHEMCRQLNKILRSETSPYYYKRAKYILQLIAECHVVQTEVDVKKGILLIECLKLIKRSKPVTDYERQQWSLHTETHTTLKLSSLSKHRLPLHPLLFGDSGSAWKILTPELNERSASKLVPIARILSLNINKLYMIASDNFIRSHMDKSKENQLSMNPQQLTLIRTLTKEMDDYRMATAMAKKIAELLPVSEDKVQAYEWCKSISQAWLDSLSEDHTDKSTVINTHRSLCAFHRNSAVEFILQKYSLDGPETSPLIFYPEKLIFTLYRHKSIAERYFKPDVGVYPDIHQATNEIAEIHSLNILKLRISISNDWLLSAKFSDNEMDDEDSTINLANMKATSMYSVSNASGSLDNDVVHLLYVLSQSLTERTASYLLGFAFDRKNPQITNVCRVRALQCAMQLFDEKFLEKLTKEKMETLRKKLRIMVYLSEFDSIGFPIHGSQLERGNKDKVARSILASPDLRHRPRAIRLAAELCREYNLFIPATWQLILQQMVALRQMSYLHQLLPDICCHPNISSLSCLPTVWQSCVTFPLVAMTPPLNSEEIKVALISYHFLLGCPVLLQIDLRSVAHHFSSIELPLLALGCLLSDPSLDDHAQKLAAANVNVIQDQLQQLSSINHPILGQAQIEEVLKSVDEKF